MTTLTRWEPWREMTTLRHAFERFLEEPFEPRFLLPWRLDEFEPAVDVAEDENTYIVKAAMPGVKPEDVEVTLQNNVLTHDNLDPLGTVARDDHAAPCVRSLL
jgi:HSP20 family protein